MFVYGSNIANKRKWKFYIEMKEKKMKFSEVIWCEANELETYI